MGWGGLDCSGASGARVVLTKVVVVDVNKGGV